METWEVKKRRELVDLFYCNLDNNKSLLFLGSLMVEICSDRVLYSVDDPSTLAIEIRGRTSLLFSSSFSLGATRSCFLNFGLFID